jgi:hypothetical protein
MTTKAPTPVSLPGSLPIAPTEDEWQKMTPDERERLLEKVLDSLSDPRRLTGMVEELEAKAQLAEANAKQAAARAKQAKAETEQAKARAELATAGLREGVLAVLVARGIACPDDARARLLSCDDPAVLQRWLARATSVGSAADVFEE